MRLHEIRHTCCALAAAWASPASIGTMTLISATPLFRPVPRSRCGVVLAVILACGTSTRLTASDLLDVIPAEVAGVVILPNLHQTAEKLSTFIKTLDPDFPGIDLGILEETLDFAPGTWDMSKPVALILTQPSFDFLTEPELGETATVLAFVPRDPDRYAALVGHRENVVRRIEQGGRAYYVTIRDGVVFFGGKRKILRLMNTGTRSDSLGAELEAEQKDIYRKSDLFVHLPVARWRDKVHFFSLLAANMLKLGMVTHQDAEVLQLTKLTVDWFLSGFRVVVEQAHSLTVAASFDGQTFRLVHHAAFRADGSVAEYLGQVHRGGADLWSALPDRPFYFLAAFDWQCPASASVTIRFDKYFLNTEPLAEKLPEELRSEIIEKSIACYSQMKGSFALVTSPPGRLHPFEVLGGYEMENAREGLEQLRFLHQHAGEMMSGLSIGNYSGKIERRQWQDREYYEMPLAPETLKPAMRRQIASLYGEDLRLQDAIVGEHCIVYSMSSNPEAIVELMRTPETGRNIGRNPRVREVLDRLPADPHGVIILNLGRLLHAVPAIVKINAAAASADSPSEQDAAVPDSFDESPRSNPGPMLGWSCRVGPTCLSGCLAISAEDLRATIGAARDMAVGLRAAADDPRPPAARPRSNN